VGSASIARALLLAGAAVVMTEAAGAGQESSRMVTYDDLLVRVDERAPGFGGMFIDADGRLAVYLLDTSKLPATRTAIETVFGSSSGLPAEMRAVQGQYSISQLKTWTDRAAALLAMDGVTMVDLDEGKNRVTVGIVDDSQTAAVEQALSSLDIPRAAVVITLTGEIKPVADALASQDSARRRSP
jgi:hypothetical protein